MPLIFNEAMLAHGMRGNVGLWNIVESEADLAVGLALHPAETEQLATIKGEGRRREFLAARQLLHTMSGRAVRGELRKDEHGKPHLVASPLRVSISHTTGFSAAVAHPLPCGVDVQVFVPNQPNCPRLSAAEAIMLGHQHCLFLQHLILV
ncbi:MAG: hypothetical protein HC821_02740, partial [Lewinella sp.]|nr:hypothetical protein [Lewinella sp.]